MTFLLSACRKDFDTTTITTDPVKFIQTSIHGAIYGPNNEPIMNAIVKKGNLQAVTDSNGYFFLLPSPCDQNGVPVQISANGYFSITKTVTPNAKGGTPLFAKLTPRILNATIPSGQGGVVEFQGASVKFPENGFVTSSGQPYSGPVQVYATFLNPNDQDMQDRMPGNLTAIRTDGSAAVLATFGMIGVELRSPAGAELNLAPGQEAEITIPLSTAYANAAPSEIPLWHFDDTSGKWREEGKAILQGNKYVGKVSHFSFWNCDIPFEAIRLSGTITDNDGNPVQSAIVKLTAESGTATGLPPGSMAYAITNQEGSFSGFVPANTELLLEVRSQCNTVIHSQNIGSLSSNTVLPNISVQSDVHLQSVEGLLVNCDLEPLIPPAYVKINIGNEVYFIIPDENGVVQAVLITCQESTLTVTGFDPVNRRQSQSVDFSILSGGRILNFGQIQTCDLVEEYIHVEIDGFSYDFIDVFSSKETLQGNAADSSIFTLHAINFDVSPPQIYFLQIQLRDVQNNISYAISCQGPSSCNALEVQITENGGIGDFMAGNFEGTFPNVVTSLPVEVSVTFRVRKN